MRTKGEHIQKASQKERNIGLGAKTFIWLSRNLSQACHANPLVRNDPKDFQTKKGTKKTGDMPAYLRWLCRIKVIVDINK